MREIINLCEQQLVLEMPLTDYQLHGDFDQPGSLGAKDRKLVSGRNHRVKMTKLLARGAPIAVHIANVPVEALHQHGVFDDVDTKESDAELAGTYQGHLVGEMTPEKVKRIANTTVVYDPASINAVILGNTQATAPLTAWMILHRLAHIVIDATFQRSPTVHSKLADQIEELSEYCSTIGLFTLADIATMRSAVNKNLETEEEIIPEIIAQYLSAGRVSFKGDQIRDRFKRQLPVAELEQQFNRMIGDIVGSMIGRGFVGF